MIKIQNTDGASLVGHVATPNAGDLDPTLGQETRSHDATKSLYAITKDPMCHNQDLDQPNKLIN